MTITMGFLPHAPRVHLLQQTSPGMKIRLSLKKCALWFMGIVIVCGLLGGGAVAMVTPARFAEMALPHGTTSVVADPHELANVCGTAALRFLLASAQTLPLSIFLALPS